MKKLISLLFLAGLAHATCDSSLQPTYTTRAGIAVPQINSCGWGTTTNLDWGIVDSSAAFLATPNTFTSSITFTNPLIIQNNQHLQFNDASSHAVTIRSSQTVANTNFVLPAADGTSGQFIRTDGTGNLSFGSAPGAVSTLGVSQSSVSVSTPTAALNFIGPPFSLTLTGGNTAQVNLDVSSVTLQGNTFNGTNQLVKLDSSSRLPVVDGSQLTNLSVSGVKIYPATGTPSFPFGFSASTGVFSNNVDITGHTRTRAGKSLAVYGSGDVVASTITNPAAALSQMRIDATSGVGINLAPVAGQDLTISTVVASSVSVNTALNLNYITGTQCLHTVNGVTSGTGSDCGSGGGGGGSSSLAVTTGTSAGAFNTIISSPTGALVVNPAQFLVTNPALTTAYMTLDPSSVTLRGYSWSTTVDSTTATFKTRLDNLDTSTNTLTTRIVAVGVSTAAIAVSTGAINTDLQLWKSVTRSSFTAVATSTAAIAVSTTALAPGGSTGDVQFNSGSAGFSGNSSFNYDNTHKSLTIYNTTVDPGFGTIYPVFGHKKVSGASNCDFYYDDSATDRGFGLCQTNDLFKIRRVSAISGLTSLADLMTFQIGATYPGVSSVTVHVPLVVSGSSADFFDSPTIHSAGAMQLNNASDNASGQVYSNGTSGKKQLTLDASGTTSTSDGISILAPSVTINGYSPILSTSTLQTGSTVYIASATVNTALNLPYLTVSQCVQTDSTGKLVSSGGACGGSGGTATTAFSTITVTGNTGNTLDLVIVSTGTGGTQAVKISSAGLFTVQPSVLSSSAVLILSTSGATGLKYDNTPAAPTDFVFTVSSYNTTNLLTVQNNGTVTISTLNFTTDGSSQTVAYTSNTVVFAITTSSSTSLTNFIPTTLTLTITPKLATHRILLTFTGSLFISNASNSGMVALARNSSVIGNGCSRAVNGAGAETDFPVSCIDVDAPGTTSAVTYTVYIKSGTAGQSVGLVSNGERNVLMAQELP